MTIEDRVEALERRVRALEDHVAILNLLARYGPTVDAGASAAAAALFTGSGAYDVGGMWRADGREALTALFDGETHQSLIRTGSAHVTTAPAIEVDGDTARAVAHSFVLLRAEDGYRVWRASANHWRLHRTPQGWRIAERYNRELDGSAESRAILARAVTEGA